MVMKAETLFEAVETVLGHGVGNASELGALEYNTAIVLLSAAGKLFKQETARRFAELKRIIFVCGRYEGVEERGAQHLATDEISIGGFVLSGGGVPPPLSLVAVGTLFAGGRG